jgi:NAD(P)H-dependent FMN reductase
VTDLKIGIILGSTRPGRNGAQVAQWVKDQVDLDTRAEFEVVDLADFNLPNYDEAIPASMGQYQNEHTQAFAAAIAKFDGFIILTPEYNHSISGALKNAFDFVYGEWNNKAAAIVSWGSVGGARAAEHVRLILAELQVATVRAQLMFTFANDFADFTTFSPNAGAAAAVEPMLDQLVSWSAALKSVRENAEVAA